MGAPQRWPGSWLLAPGCSGLPEQAYAHVSPNCCMYLEQRAAGQLELLRCGRTAVQLLIGSRGLQRQAFRSTEAQNPGERLLVVMTP